ncbi:sialate O-acetylesterase [Rhodopirellula sp. MGV]|uniref:sialate O-acetylesterase n=1 Tax=Rhodopirellula sp. MGV TaxID=2023130 RepID=UPI000B965230|nr:sialate O-acetylesterase [Rhodopirellula sp. MGV]OYP39120.1 9-O-acetylesterase [Rhodopirellula sp. MGV]PNY35502.1 9-O-acetylesterase [Rhodopirellula baltica]
MKLTNLCSRVCGRWGNAIALTAVGLAASIANHANADVRLPGFYGDHMVLQQQKPIRVWGWADTKESVSVSFAGNTAETVADADGKWHVELPAIDASHEARSLTVKGNNTIELTDVLVGEVWLCSGQSNMEWDVRGSSNSSAEIAAANDSLIRHIKFAHRPSNDPIDDVAAPWELCSPKTVGRFTACGYFMAKRLRKDIDVPIGLINSSWGGTRVEPWTPPVGFEQVDALQDIYQAVETKMPGSDLYNKTLESHVEATENWVDEAKKDLSGSKRVSPSPAFPTALRPWESHQDPTMLYNGMIHAIVGFPIRGAIWYQGESNHGEGMLYFEKKKALINGWRQLWDQGDFPFYFVQIAPYQYGDEDPTILAKFWEAQAAVQQLPNVGMVVINDIATLQDIHPPNKQDVGERLALWALKHDYGKSDLTAASPSMESMKVDGDRLIVTFKDTAGGLKTRDGKTPSHFEVVGADSYGFQPATAKIEGNQVILTSEKVNSPTAFRFAWHKLAEPNLMGGSGLPVGAFRGGEVPDFVSTLAIERDYALVFDANLKSLGGKIEYDVDNSGNIDSFDRVGYLVELTTGSGEEQKVFVAMDAFTDDAKKLGIPVASLGNGFQQRVKNLDVFSNQPSIKSGTGIAEGNIEFWPNNYGQTNSSQVPGASGASFDFGDQPAPPHNGYGSMQIHNFAARQTIFAINNWNNGGGADLGIGNGSGENPDWTFSGNANTYSAARLRIYVKKVSGTFLEE